MDNETIENNKKDIEIFLENQNDVSLLAILKSDTETLANQEVLFNVFDGNNNILIRTISIKTDDDGKAELANPHQQTQDFHIASGQKRGEFCITIPNYYTPHYAKMQG